jgi:hypothetical protein
MRSDRSFVGFGDGCDFPAFGQATDPAEIKVRDVDSATFESFDVLGLGAEVF